MKEIQYITLEGKSAPRSNDNIIKFNCVTAIIRDKKTKKYLALEFIQGEYGLVGGKIETGENKQNAIIREVEEETGYKNAKIINTVFEKIYSRGYKARKNREEEALDTVYLIEVEEEQKTKILGADIGTQGVHWFDREEMLNRLTLTHHIHFFKHHIQSQK